MKETKKKKLRNIVNAGIIILGLGLGAYKAQQFHCNNNTTIKSKKDSVGELYFNAGCRLRGGSYSVLTIDHNEFYIEEWTWLGLKRHEYLDVDAGSVVGDLFRDGNIDIAGETTNIVFPIGFEVYYRQKDYKQNAVSFERGDMLLAQMTDKYGGVETLKSIIDQIEGK